MNNTAQLAYYSRSGRVRVNTGLSSSIVGCVVRLVRDDTVKVGMVVVDIPEDARLTDVQRTAIHQTAKLLAERARRFLGIRWRIVPWSGF